MSDTESSRPDQEYRSLAERWSPNPARPRIAHPVSAGQFLQEIEFLRRLMAERNVAAWQRPFDDVLGLIREVGMLRNGDWDPYWFDIGSPHIDDSIAIELVDDLTDPDRVQRHGGSNRVSAPVSRRIAIATAVAEHGLPGNSFDAACKRLQRLIEDRDRKSSDIK